MKTNVYVDGFNLYYGCLRKTPCRWLNIAKMCHLLLREPAYTVNHIKFFTAQVTARPHDPSQPVRQQVYFRALNTLPNVTIYYGRFLSKPSWLPYAEPTPAQIAPNGEIDKVKVMRTEEKGSDVNLATHLLMDAFRGDFEAAAVVTNDSDLYEPIKVVTQDLGLPVVIINPHKRPSQELLKLTSNIKQIRKGLLSASQFPDQLEDANGIFNKPSEWS